MLADPQYALDLHTTATSTPVDGTAKLRKTKASPVFHLHLHTVDGTVFEPVARITTEGLHALATRRRCPPPRSSAGWPASPPAPT